MQVADLLEEQAGRILAKAMESVDRAHLCHYESVGKAETEQRLRRLLELVIECTRSRRLAPIQDHAEQLAHERHAAGCDLAQVQTAFNVLEEAAWTVILEHLPPVEQGQALGVVATVLGAAKDRLACAFVALVGQRVSSLDLEKLFQGTDSLDIS